MSASWEGRPRCCCCIWARLGQRCSPTLQKPGAHASSRWWWGSATTPISQEVRRPLELRHRRAAGERPGGLRTLTPRCASDATRRRRKALPYEISTLILLPTRRGRTAREAENRTTAKHARRRGSRRIRRRGIAIPLSDGDIDRAAKATAAGLASGARIEEATGTRWYARHFQRGWSVGPGVPGGFGPDPRISRRPWR